MGRRFESCRAHSYLFLLTPSAQAPFDLIRAPLTPLVDTACRWGDIGLSICRGATVIESQFGPSPSEKSRGVALALAAILGPFGAHRFYVGKPGTAVLMLCTLGGAGLWYLYDLIMVAGGSFRDAHGRLVSIWDPEQPAQYGGELPPELIEELSALRTDLAELAERLDFAERLLAGSRQEDSRAQSSLKV